MHHHQPYKYCPICATPLALKLQMGENEKKLGQTPAFSVNTYKEKRYVRENKFGYPEYEDVEVTHLGISKRYYTACHSQGSALDVVKNMSVKDLSLLIGIDSDQFNYVRHMPIALVKVSYMIADELLKQEHE